MCPYGVRAIQDDVVGVHQIGAVVDPLDVRMVAKFHIHAEEPRQEPPSAVRFDVGIGDASTCGFEEIDPAFPTPSVRNDGARTVLVIYAFEFRCDQVKRLVPADALPLVFSAKLAMGVLPTARLPVLALHGILDAVGVVELLSQGMATRASALLPFQIRRVVGFLAHDDAVDNVADIHTSAAAVFAAEHRTPFALAFQDGGVRRNSMWFQAIVIVLWTLLVLAGGATRERCSRKRCRRSDSTSTQEIATPYVLFKQCHVIPLSCCFRSTEPKPRPLRHNSRHQLDRQPCFRRS